MADRRSRLATRLAVVYSVAFLAVLTLFSGLIAGSMSESLSDQIVEAMVDAAEVAQSELRRGTDPATLVEETGAAIGARVTIIDGDGTVVADSEANAAEMDDHSDRPEVVDAVRGRIGVSQRGSATLGDDRLYVAIPSSAGEPIVRISRSRAQVERRVSAIVRQVWVLAVPVGLVGLAGVALIGRRLARPIEDLTERAADLAAGELDMSARRSTISEIDRLGVAMAETAEQLGSRIRDADEQRSALDSALSALPQGVLLVEADNSVSVSNEAADLLLGHHPERLDQVAPVTVRRLVHAVRGRGGVADDEVRLGRPERIVAVVASLIEGRDGRVLVVLSDVTEQRRVEAVRRDFVADASHELKTPIAGVLASIEAMRLAIGRDPEAVVRFADQADGSARRLAAIVGDLLDLSRLESSELEFQRVALGELVMGEIEAARRSARVRDLVIETDVDSVDTHGDAAELELAVRNLIDNAIRYTEAGGSVRLSLRENGDHAVLTVADTGTGIPSRSLGRIFERFYRVDDARSRATGGTGLGLALVRHVVERHGGAVTVDSELGVGSTFTVRLPRAEDDAPREATP